MSESSNRKFSTAVLKRNWKRINNYMATHGNGVTLPQYPVVNGVDFYLLSEDGVLEPHDPPSIGHIAFKLYI
jgi:hypothetical protein